MGLMMELVSETDEQTMVLGEATVTTRCLAMFATPMRERAVKNKVKFKVKLGIQHNGGYFGIVYTSFCIRGYQILSLSFNHHTASVCNRKLNEEKQTCFFGMPI